jgi:GDPmannose 4,6-dehydratase
MAWSGAGKDEVGTVASVAADSPAKGLQSGQAIVRVDAAYFRPAEVETLLGDASRARAKLKWRPRTPFEALVAEMTEADLALAKREKNAGGRGLKVYRPDLEGK